MSNQADLMNKFYGQTEAFIGPMAKANQVAVANFEKVVDFQFKAWQKYMDMGINQMKAAAEIDSPNALQAFWGKQLETANTVREQIMDDVKVMAELGNDMKDDFSKLTEDNVRNIKTTASKAKKAA